MRVDKTITVEGGSTVSIAPDQIILSLTLSAKEETYEKTMAQAEQSLSSLQSCFSFLGFEKEDIKTQNYKVSLWTEQIENQGRWETEYKGYCCIHQLSLAFDMDMKKLSVVLAALSNSGSLPCFTVQFTVKDKNKVQEELLYKAAENARKKAEILAAASGVKLGELAKIDYHWDNRPIFSTTSFDDAYLRTASSSFSSPVSEISPQEIEVSDRVIFLWEIQ